MARREGIFCDFDSGKCPNIAVGRCIGCNHDVCSIHGSETALSISIQRQAKGTTSYPEVMRTGIAMCWECVLKMDTILGTLRENLVPALKDAITEGVASALAANAMRGTKQS